ncbi:MAG TPA: hypothetical protein PLK31_04935 [Chloroflexota bacterium]|nr:hypothetical protein [Chloroflexota bacterium]
MPPENPFFTGKAKISSTGQWLAYRNDEGLYYANLSNGEATLLSAEEGEIGPDVFVFSPDGQKIAFRDNEGLKIVDLNTNQPLSVWQNDLEGIYDGSLDITIYNPLNWSPDQNWLLLWIGKWEGGWLAIGSPASKDIYFLSGCYPDTSWSPDTVEFAMVVRYDAYQGCGGVNDGVYVVSLAETIPSEQLMYTDPTFAPSNGLNGAASVAWSPDNQWIMFVHESEIAPQAQLLLTTSDGSEIKVLTEVANGRILTPIWSPDSNTIYCVVVESTGSHSVYEINPVSLGKRNIYNVSEDDEILDISPDGQWLVLGARYYHDNYTNYNNQTTILNVVTGETVKIGTGHTSMKIIPIGWQPLP